MLTVNLEIQYERTEQAPGERAPLYLAMHLDRYFERPVTMLINPDQNGMQSVEIGGIYRNDSSVTMLLLPADASLCMQAFTTVPNHEGILCRQDSGVRTLPLSLLVKAQKEKKSIRAPLRIHTTQKHLIRGIVTLRVLHMQASTIDEKSKPYVMGIGRNIHTAINYNSASNKSSNGYNKLNAPHPYQTRILEAAAMLEQKSRILSIQAKSEEIHPSTVVTLRFDQPRPYHNLACNLKHINKEVKRYLETFAREQKHYAIVHGGTENIECPLDPSEVTVANSQLAVPFAAYVLHEKPRISARWWQVQWGILARRRGFMNGQAFACWLEKQSAVKQSAIAMAWCSQFVEMLPYVADMIGSGKAVEMFGEALAMLNGDCEDGASAILMVRDEMRQCGLRLIEKADSKEEARVQQRLQHIARQYVDLLCIDGVTASHVAAEQYDPTGGRNECTAAHAALHALPRDYFSACVGRWKATHPLANLKIAPELKGHLLPIIGEGTGVIDPGVEWDRVQRARQQLFGYPVMSHLKKQMFGQPGKESGFYKVTLFGATNLFFDNHRTATFHFTQLGASPHINSVPLPSEKRPKGVHYTQIMARDKNIVLIPYAVETENREEEFTLEQARILRNVAKNRIPPPPLLAPQEVMRTRQEEAHHQPSKEQQSLSTVEEWCQKMNASLVGAENDQANTAPVCIFPYCDQINSDFMKNLHDAALDCRQLLSSVECHLEQHHSCINSVCIAFNCYEDDDRSQTEEEERQLLFSNVIGIGAKTTVPKSTDPPGRGRLIRPTTINRTNKREEVINDIRIKKNKKQRNSNFMQMGLFKPTHYAGDDALLLKADQHGPTPRLSIRYVPDYLSSVAYTLEPLTFLRYVPLVETTIKLGGKPNAVTPNRSVYYYWVHNSKKAFYVTSPHQRVALMPNPWSRVPDLSNLARSVEENYNLPYKIFNAAMIEYYPSRNSRHSSLKVPETTVGRREEENRTNCSYREINDNEQVEPWLYSNDGETEAVSAIVSIGESTNVSFSPRLRLLVEIKNNWHRQVQQEERDDDDDDDDDDDGGKGVPISTDGSFIQPEISVRSGSLMMIDGKTTHYWKQEVTLNDGRIDGREKKRKSGNRSMQRMKRKNDFRSYSGGGTADLTKSEDNGDFYRIIFKSVYAGRLAEQFNRMLPDQQHLKQRDVEWMSEDNLSALLRPANLVKTMEQPNAVVPREHQ